MTGAFRCPVQTAQTIAGRTFRRHPRGGSSADEYRLIFCLFGIPVPIFDRQIRAGPHRNANGASIFPETLTGTMLGTPHLLPARLYYAVAKRWLHSPGKYESLAVFPNAD